MTAAWLLLVGLLAKSVRGYIWLTLFASVVAWLCALVLARIGDRGVAVGMALTTSMAVAVTAALVLQRWLTTGWPLW